ncbi:MAG TPA: asparagine synthase [Micromonosporaceae bacterium]|nr:asparagine synthase [Micromonosporaceae bacterium]
MPEPHGMPSHGEAFFVVLPDHENALAVASRMRRFATRAVTHPSGRPWLMGRWLDDDITAVEAGNIRLAVIGSCAVTAAELNRRADRLRNLAELDHLAQSLPGSFHLLAAMDGRLRVQGTASGLRLVFHAGLEGITVAADRADVLAALITSELDERQVAVRLLWPVPHPLLSTPLWRGVTAVEPERYLVVEPDGRSSRCPRWWKPPEPTLSLAQGAPLVADALAAAVAVRTRAGGTVSCDLSGGLDSTSVCFLAASSSAAVIASTWPGRDPADDDLFWARRAAAHLRGVEHVVWDAEEAPLVYANLLGIDDPLDEPSIGVMDRARVLQHVPALAAMGSRLHLTGIGGDHVAWCSEAHYHGLLRRRPLFAISQLRGFRALFQWPLAPTIRALADSRSYGRWLLDTADHLHGPGPKSVTGALGWSLPPRLFDWVTPRAVDLVRDALKEAAESAQPLAPDRGQHADLEQIRGCTRIVRQWDQMSARAGLPMASPFLDDRVIEACLAVRADERVTPWHYKPLLTAAMRDVVPAECLARTSKAEASLDAAHGLREHRGDLLALWADSRLAQMGLVDAAMLSRLSGRPDTPELRQPILYSTIGCEVWLRTFSTPRTEFAVTGTS